MKKAIIISALALTVFGLISCGTAKAYARNNQGEYPPIVQKLVERFDLNEDEVKAVFDEGREERQAQMQSRFEDRLSQQVAEGKISEEQKQAIITKKQEMRTSFEALKDLSPEERQARMGTHKEEMKSWAEENGIDLENIFGGFGKKGAWYGKMKGSFTH